MLCSHCGKEIPNDSLFCSFCGQKNEGAVCPTCGAALEEDSVFCSACGTKIHEQSDPAAETPASGQAKMPNGKKKRAVAIILLAVALALSAAGNAYLGFESSSQKNQIVSLEADISRLTEENTSLDKMLSQTEKKADSLETAGNVYSGIKSFASSSSANTFKQNKDLYTYSNAVILKKGKTASISIVWANSGTIYWECSNQSVANPNWQDGWKGSTATLDVTGLKVGTAILTISNSFNDHELKILAIVTE